MSDRREQPPKLARAPLVGARTAIEGPPGQAGLPFELERERFAQLGIHALDATLANVGVAQRREAFLVTIGAVVGANGVIGIGAVNGLWILRIRSSSAPLVRMFGATAGDVLALAGFIASGSLQRPGAFSDAVALQSITGTTTAAATGFQEGTALQSFTPPIWVPAGRMLVMVAETANAALTWNFDVAEPLG